MTKTCPNCGITKELAEFNRCVAHSDGLQTYCRACQYAKDGLWRAAHIDEVRAKDRERKRKAWRTS